MEIIFLLIAVILTLVMTYGVGRLVYSHEALLRAYKKSDNLMQIHLMIGIVITLILFMTLCAFNNTFWHLPYLTK